MLTVERMNEHVAQLAAAFHVGVDVRPGMNPSAAVAQQTLDGGHHRIVIAPIVDETTYAVALHELGHCVAPSGAMPLTEFSRSYLATGQPGTLRDIRLRLLEEEAAWAWAKANALEWTEVMARCVRGPAWRAYRQQARRFGA